MVVVKRPPYPAIGSKQTREERKRMLMRSANTRAENNQSVGVRTKGHGRSQKKISLPPTPWDEKK